MRRLRKSRRRYSVRATGPGPRSCHRSHRRSPRSHRTDRRNYPTEAVSECRSTDPSSRGSRCRCRGSRCRRRGSRCRSAGRARRPCASGRRRGRWVPSCRSRGSAHPFRAGVLRRNRHRSSEGLPARYPRGAEIRRRNCHRRNRHPGCRHRHRHRHLPRHRHRHHRPGWRRRRTQRRAGPMRRSAEYLRHPHRYRHGMGASARRWGRWTRFPRPKARR